jgi:hypothetical protein
MMMLIAPAISVAFVASAASALGLLDLPDQAERVSDGTVETCPGGARTSPGPAAR